MGVRAFDAATHQRELLIWFSGLELDVTATNGTVCRKSNQASPAITFMPKHLQLAASLFDGRNPVGGFNDTVVNDAEPRGIHLAPDKHKAQYCQGQGNQAAHSKRASALA
ncbi:hypothetical protein FQZ97_844750 [compost metagenome]